MGHLFSESGEQTNKGKLDLKFLRTAGCLSCPLDQLCTHKNAKMPATGADDPLVYVLGEAPGEQELEEGVQFIGKSGQLLREYVPEKYIKQMRFNNVVNCRPPNNRNPDPAEVEACRSRIETDIEKTKPKAIFGFGNVPLAWASGFNGITAWRGRYMPVKIGTHTCWYFAFTHPSYVLRGRSNRDVSEEERVFGWDIAEAFALLKELPEPVVDTEENALHGVTRLLTLKDIQNALDATNQCSAIGLDYETNCLRPYEDKAKMLSVGFSTGVLSYAFPIEHQDYWTEADLKKVKSLWREFLYYYKGRKYVHFLMFDLEWTASTFGGDLVRAGGQWDCSAVQASILDERQGKFKPGPFSLAFLSQVYFGLNMKEVFNVDRKALVSLPMDRLLGYNAVDAKYHIAVGQEQDRKIKAEGLEGAYELSRRRVPTLVLAQLRGVPVDQDIRASMSERYATKSEEVARKIAVHPDVEKFKRNFGKVFNPASSDDCADLFHKMLGREECMIYDKKKKKHRVSAEKEVLKSIGGELTELILEYREQTRAKSTYLDAFSPSGNLFPDGLIHAQFNSFGAETGRISCESPPLQQWPKRDEGMKEVRKPVVAPPGCLILSADYGQIEARVIAMFTKDKTFVDALWERYDVHQEWAERIARAYPARIGGKQNLTDKGIMKKFRTDIKNQWTFPLFFGASLKSASNYLSIPEVDLKPEYNRFWKQFSPTKDWQEDLLAFYRKYGYVECFTGRRRRAPLSVNQALNAPVQGTTGDIVMDAMCRLSESMDPDLQAEIQIHDDLTFLRVPRSKFKKVAEQVVTYMLDVPFDWAHTVPIAAELAVGPNWGDMEDCGVFSSDEFLGIKRKT